MSKKELNDKWIEEIHRTRYPSGMKVFYSVEELQTASEKGEIKKGAPVGLCYHALRTAFNMGQSSTQNMLKRMEFERMLHEDVVILVSKRAFLEHFKM